MHCANWRAALRDLPLQAAALPNLVQELRERYESEVDYEGEAPKVKHPRVVEVVPKRHIENKSDLEGALNALQGMVTEALGEADVVKLD